MSHSTSGSLVNLFPVPPKPQKPCSALMDDGTPCGSTRFWLQDAHTRYQRWTCWVGSPPPLVIVCEASTDVLDTVKPPLRYIHRDIARQLELDGVE